MHVCHAILFSPQKQTLKKNSSASRLLTTKIMKALFFEWDKRLWQTFSVAWTITHRALWSTIRKISKKQSKWGKYHQWIYIQLQWPEKPTHCEIQRDYFKMSLCWTLSLFLNSYNSLGHKWGRGPWKGMRDQLKINSKLTKTMAKQRPTSRQTLYK